MAQWTDEETLKLIEIWSEDKIQEELDGCKKNKHIYDKIAARMTKAGFERTFDQCRIKVKKLRAEYRKVKDGNNKTGEDRKEWKYFEAIDDILGTRPSTKPEVLVDTLEDEKEEVIEENVHKIDEDDESPGSSDPVEALCSSGPTSSEYSDCVVVEKRSVKKENTDRKKKGKKRPAKEERIENVMEVMVTKVLDSQRESDKLFMDLEAKRMKMEQTVLELEHQRYQEDRAREERQRREERQFQMQLYAMMCGNPRPTYGTLPFPRPSSHGSPSPPMHEAFHFPPGYPGTSTPHGSSQSCLEFEDEQ